MPRPSSTRRRLRRRAATRSAGRSPAGTGRACSWPRSGWTSTNRHPPKRTRLMPWWRPTGACRRWRSFSSPGPVATGGGAVGLRGGPGHRHVVREGCGSLPWPDGRVAAPGGRDRAAAHRASLAPRGRRRPHDRGCRSRRHRRNLHLDDARGPAVLRRRQPRGRRRSRGVIPGWFRASPPRHDRNVTTDSPAPPRLSGKQLSTRAHCCS